MVSKADREELKTFVAGMVDDRLAALEERIAVLEKQVALVAVQDRINLLSPTDGSNLIRSDSLVALRVAPGKSTPSDHDSCRSASDVFGSSRWNANPIICLCGVCDSLLLESGTLP
jgi:hypothetical protein